LALTEHHVRLSEASLLRASEIEARDVRVFPQQIADTLLEHTLAHTVNDTEPTHTREERLIDLAFHGVQRVFQTITAHVKLQVCARR
jgi:hypothetical protein